MMLVLSQVTPESVIGVGAVSQNPLKHPRPPLQGEVAEHVVQLAGSAGLPAMSLKNLHVQGAVGVYAVSGAPSP